jgi:site-specific recombinase XerD
MGNELVKIDIEQEIQNALNFSKKSVSENTIRSYKSQVSLFETWCEIRGFDVLPARPEVLCVYFSYLATSGYKRSKIERAKYAISKYHVSGGFEDPTKSEVVETNLEGIFREIGSSVDAVDPLTVETLVKIVQLFSDDSVESIRNRAIALFSFFTGNRRSETSALLRKNVKFAEHGLLVKIEKSKTDQEGRGFVKAIQKQDDRNMCAFAAMVDWFAVAPDSKYAFCHVERKGGRGSAKEGNRLSDKMIARMILKWARKVGDKTRISGHSYRSGFVTAAAIAGKSNRSIMKITGHKSNDMVDHYVRMANPFDENATTGIFGNK